MHPVKIQIYGNFWDTQIYRGQLYLFTQSGSIRTINWDSLVNSFDLPLKLRLAIECAFRRSDYLYGSYWDLFFSDPEIKTALVRKFEQLADTPLTIDNHSLIKHEIKQQDNPFPFPHADAITYGLNMYVVGQSGVWRGSCNRRTKYPLSTKAERKWDCPVRDISASYGSLSLSTGPEGLWETPVGTAFYHTDSNPKQITSLECDASEWMYYSIYGSAYESGGFLAEFGKPAAFTSPGEPAARVLSRVVSNETIFKNEGYSWGTRDKIYQARNNEIQIARYQPYGKDDEPLKYIASVPIQPWKGNLVSGGVAAFGTILEYDNALLVIPSEGEIVTIPGEPINWRIFPRSSYYQNHLHIVYDDRIEIVSFNHDYFVHQSEKLFGSIPVQVRIRT